MDADNWVFNRFLLGKLSHEVSGTVIWAKADNAADLGAINSKALVRSVDKGEVRDAKASS
jgi:hypothetical protein